MLHAEQSIFCNSVEVLDTQKKSSWENKAVPSKSASDPSHQEEVIFVE